MMPLVCNPFDSNLKIGSVYKVNAATVEINLPAAGDTKQKFYCGYRIGNGEVNELVFIECGVSAIFGRIVETRLPERERLDIEKDSGKKSDIHPLATMQLLATVDIVNSKVNFGFNIHPRLGANVYSAHPELIKWVLEQSQNNDEKKKITLNFANLPEVDNLDLGILPEQLFGRHCAVLGATGGGKSWTVASIICSTLKYGSKVVLLDATGEYHKLPKESTTHVYIGEGDDKAETKKEIVFSYKNLTETDLFSMFTPSRQIQAPKLKDAIKSLKLAKLKPEIVTEGLIVKVKKNKAGFEAALKEKSKEMSHLHCNFDIDLLSRQIQNECVKPDYNDDKKWGQQNDFDLSMCTSLQMRIENMIEDISFACLFKPEGKQDFTNEIDVFLKDDKKKVLRVALQNIPFSYNAREIVANAIGRHLLDLARKGEFKINPLLVFVDEAHQFLDKSLGDEFTRIKLDSFGLIAKEGRKYGLNICISTQRPRDIPEDVLSQMGTLIVHRLVNDNDRRVVERASGEIDRMSSEFLPSLGPGEAILVGVDFPIPVVIKMKKPPEEHRPDSEGPKYNKSWTRLKGVYGSNNPV